MLAFGALATALRKLRAEAGLTYDELAVKTGLSPTALKCALAGRTLSSWESVTAINEACGGSDAVLELWRQARTAGRGRLPKLHMPGAPEHITTQGARRCSSSTRWLAQRPCADSGPWRAVRTCCRSGSSTGRRFWPAASSAWPS